MTNTEIVPTTRGRKRHTGPAPGSDDGYGGARTRLYRENTARKAAILLQIGTSGWQYAHWRGSFYPRGLAQSEWLEHYATVFATVELNVSFYRLPPADDFAAWARRTPEGFRFAAKVSRYLTHIKRLVDPAEPVARFLDRAEHLGSKLGPVLLQLPPNLTASPQRLDETLAQFPPRVRVAVEPRHPSWWVPAVRQVLTDRRAALCWSDRAGRPQTPLWRTADFGYLRLHEGRAAPWPRYGPRALDSWLARVRDTFAGEECFIYFNNDQHGAATLDARAMTERAARAGFRTDNLGHA